MNHSKHLMRKAGIILFFWFLTAAVFAQEFVETEAGKVYYEMRGSGDALLLLSGGPGAIPNRSRGRC